MRAPLVALALTVACAHAQSLAENTNLQRARGFLESALKDRNPDTRRHAVEALSLLNAQEPWISDLEAAVSDKNMDVQLAAIASLVDLKTGRTVPSLEKALNSPSHEVAFAAAKALWALKQPSGEKALLSVLSGDMKTSAGFFTQQKRNALRKMHTPAGTFLFIVTTGVQMAPVPGLGFGASSMQGILTDSGVPGRASAALLLADDKDPRVVEALRKALNDRNWSVRAAAVHAIAQRNDPNLAPALVPLFEDKKDGVRVRAAAGYLRLSTIK